MEPLNFSYALLLGRRQIAENIKNWLEEMGGYPLITVYDDDILTTENIRMITILKPEYIFCIHYHRIVPKEILAIPKKGCINLHPAYLPYNRGWNTPSWAILDGTPYGATMHYMTEEIDAGDIIYKESFPVAPEDTAHTLYQKVLALEEEVFKKGFQMLIDGTATRIHQEEQWATSHKKSDLKIIQEIDPDDPLLIKLKALTTNHIEEAEYFEKNGKRYAVQVKIEELK